MQLSITSPIPGFPSGFQSLGGNYNKIFKKRPAGKPEFTELCLNTDFITILS